VPALNLAVCWDVLIYLNLSTKSAVNLLNLNLLGIFRDYSPELIFCNCCLIPNLNENSIAINNSNSEKYLFIKDQSNKNKILFGQYLAGLIESVGLIYVPKTEKSIKGKFNYPSIQISFHLKEFPLAMIIQKTLGHGSLNKIKGAKAYNLIIHNPEGIVFVINLINNKFRTSKILTL
jgi:hypothetical protein